MNRESEIIALDAELARDGAPALLSKREAAAILHVTTRTLDRRRSAGLLRGLRTGGRRLFRRRDVAAHVVGGVVE